MDNAINASLRITIIYIVFATLWILFSDLAVETLFISPNLRAQAQTYKGLFFVFTTGLLLFFLVFRNNRIIEQAHDLDPLTGLYNITLFKRQLDRLILSLKPGEQLVLGYIDIDNFKDINRQLGFERADAFLVDLALGLVTLSVKGSVMSRLQGDQFAVVSRLESDLDLEAHATEFQKVVRQSGEHFGLAATSCIGVALFPEDGKSSKELMQSATQALRQAKTTNNRIQYHDKLLEKKVAKQRQLVADLKKALQNEQLQVVYQPKYHVHTLQPSGVEVLVRWQHPRRGAIAPTDFIPIAEEHDLCNELSRLVVKLAATELQASGLLGTCLHKVSVNISATEFNSETTMTSLANYLKDFPEFTRQICLEITETATLTDMKKSAQIISNLHAQGITFSVDDFGTGYTSLSMLKDLTVNEIKIDRSFVSDLQEDTRSRTIIQAIIAMAESFGIGVVAEGVETAEQLEILKDMGCLEVQGYYLGRPMPISQLVTHLKPANDQVSNS